VKRIYRTYNDTEVTQLSVAITCPYCGEEWLEPDVDECGKTHKIVCENGDCDKEFEMYFDAS
jgi:transcription elongation factor Elf1